MSNLSRELAGKIGNKQVYTDDLTLIATAADAGCYRKIPEIVLKPTSEEQVVDSLRILYKHNRI